jgi:hypothetical protein
MRSDGQLFERELSRASEAALAQVCSQSRIGGEPSQRILHRGRIPVIDDERLAVGDFAHDRNVVHDAWRTASHRFDDASPESFLAARQTEGNRLAIKRGEPFVIDPIQETHVATDAEFANLILRALDSAFPTPADHHEWMFCP